MTITLDKFFIILQIDRKEITGYYGEDKEKFTDKITDEEMEAIALKMNDLTCDGYGYWEALENAMKDTLSKELFEGICG